MDPVFVVEVAGLRIPDTIVVTLGLTLLLTVLLAAASRRLGTRGIGRWQAAVEAYVDWIRDTVKEVFGEDPAPFVPLIGALMGFIAVSNLLSVVPWLRPPTADLSTAVALSLVVFCAVPYYGIRRLGVRRYLHKYLEPHPVLMPLNVIGELSRTLALAVRLFGNVMSAQMIGGILLVIAGVLVPIPLMMLGILTGLVQAYIFGILAAVYIAAAVEVHDTPENPMKDIPETKHPGPQEALSG